MSERMAKISFLGDITLDRPMLTSGKRDDGSYDFSGTFDALFKMLADSDCVVGNLETIFAGKEFGYNPGLVSYNSPDSFLPEIKKISPNLLLTIANNHCLDLGMNGLTRTVKLLDETGIRYTGVFSGSEKRYTVLNMKGIRVAFVSFTSVINNRENGLPHSFDELQLINCLFSEKVRSSLSAKQRIAQFLPSEFIRKVVVSIRKKRSDSVMKPFSDDYDIPSYDAEALERASQLLEEAESNSDVVVACVHSGGQFNEQPGKYSRQLTERLSEHAKFIVCNHPHVVQKIINKPPCLCAFSLGSLNISTSADYIIPDFLPEYSIALHLYFGNDDCGNVICKKASFSLLKAVENEDHFVRVLPARELFESASADEQDALLRDVNTICQRCLGRNAWISEIPEEIEIA